LSGRLHHGRQGDRGFAGRKKKFSAAKRVQKVSQLQEHQRLHRRAQKSQAFWAKAAKDLHWFKPWKKFSSGKSPWAKWFVGGKLNASYNCLDRHVKKMRDLTDLPCFTMFM
jgi:hypothetical protein